MFGKMWLTFGHKVVK